MCAITGRSSTGTIGFGSSNVRGRSRVPRPAARTIAFIRADPSTSLTDASTWLARTQGAWPAHAGERSRTPPGASMHPSGALLPGREICPLRVGEDVNLDVHGRERETRDLVVELGRHAVDLRRERAGGLDEVLRGERMVGERHV